MTFIYNQLIGVLDEINPLVFCETSMNLDRFPYKYIFPHTKNIDGRTISYLNRITGRRSTSISPRQFLFWEKISKQHSVKLIHAHFGPAGIELLPLSKKLNVPLIVSIYGYDAASYLNNKHYVNSLKLLSKEAYILCNSEKMKNRLLSIGIPDEKITTLYLGANVDKFRYVKRQPIYEKMSKNNDIYFLQVANFVEKKGHEYTVKAFSKLVADYPNLYLTFAGNGPLKDKILHLVKKLNLNKNIQIIDAVNTEEMKELMINADIFLHHSITAANGDMEGIPTVLMEAMATGLPVISTDHSGIPELITHNVDGFLVKEKDINGYIRQIKETLTNQRNISEMARKKIEIYFNMSMQLTRLKYIYRELIKDGKQY